MNINPNQIEVFPFGSHRPSHPNGRTMSEINLTRYLKSIADNQDFVISKTFSPNSNFEFMIHGYYFCVNGEEASNVDNHPFYGITFTTLYAIIYIDESNPDAPVLYGEDKEDEFTGVTFSSTTEAGITVNAGKSTKYVLPILTKDRSGNLIVPTESLLKFNTSSIDIDGGYYE